MWHPGHLWHWQQWNTSLAQNAQGPPAAQPAQSVPKPALESASGGLSQPSPVEVKSTGRTALPEVIFIFKSYPKYNCFMHASCIYRKSRFHCRIYLRQIIHPFLHLFLGGKLFHLMAWSTLCNIILLRYL